MYRLLFYRIVVCGKADLCTKEGSRMIQEKEKNFGIFFYPPTLAGVKKVQDFLEKKGFPLPVLCLYIPGRGIWQNSESLIKEFGPNVRIWDGLSIDSENKECSIEFKSGMFGNKDTMKVMYRGDEKFVAFIDKNFRKIYRKSYYLTLNPFYGGKTRLTNPLKAICTAAGDLLTRD